MHVVTYSGVSLSSSGELVGVSTVLCIDSFSVLVNAAVYDLFLFILVLLKLPPQHFFSSYYVSALSNCLDILFLFK